MRDEPDAEAAGNQVGHGQGHPVDGHAALADDVTEDGLGGGDIEPPVGAFTAEVGDVADAIDMAGHEVSAHAVGRQKAGLDVDDASGREFAQVGQA